MNRKLTKAISIFMSAAIATSCTALCSFAIDKDVDYKISSTYANVDWSTYKQYKTDLHTGIYQGQWNETVDCCRMRIPHAFYSDCN